MKDPFGRGLIAGIIGVIFINIIEFIMMLLKFSETPLWQAGGIVFLSEEALQTPLGITIGILSHVFVAIAVGIAISYYITYTGIDLAIFKATGVSLIALFFVLGIFFPLRGLATEMQDSTSDTMAAFIDHIAFGIIAGFVVKYLQVRNQTDDSEQGNKKTIYVHPKQKLVKSKKQQKFKKPHKI
jgi:hypothetical protein